MTYDAPASEERIEVESEDAPERVRWKFVRRAGGDLLVIYAPSDGVYLADRIRCRVLVDGQLWRELSLVKERGAACLCRVSTGTLLLGTFFAISGTNAHPLALGAGLVLIIAALGGMIAAGFNGVRDPWYPQDEHVENRPFVGFHNQLGEAPAHHLVMPRRQVEGMPDINGPD